MHGVRQRPTCTAVHWIVALLTVIAARPVVGQTKPEPDLSQVRSALEKYKDPYVAIHDGFFSTLGCVEIARAGAAGHVPYKPGGMGVHFLNVGNIGPVPDPAKPQVLIYEPDGDKLRLVAAEWFIPLSTGVKARPTLWGRAFDDPMTGTVVAPNGSTHYDLHVWLTESIGDVRPTNPDVKCAGHPIAWSRRRPSWFRSLKPSGEGPVYTVSKHDRVHELTDVPFPALDAPMPLVLADESTLAVS